MSVGFDAFEGQSAVKAIALENKEPFALGEGLVEKWLPGLDKLRNGFWDAENMSHGIAELQAMESIATSAGGPE